MAGGVHMNAEMPTRTRTRIAALPAVGVAGDWTINTGYTLVQFAVKQLGFTTAHGRFIDIWGTIHCGDEADPASASVEATIAAASIATGDIRQDAYLRSTAFLDVERYPTITFTSTRVERMAKDRLRVTGTSPSAM
jgi:polyisoprenoid-binding protein YceI